MSEEKGMVSQEAVTTTSADAGSIMPLAADLSRTQDVTTVSEVSTINSTDQFYMNQSGKFVQVDYSKLADAILGKISSKTYSLDQGTKTLIAAINELNSKSILSIGYLQIDEYRNGARLIHGELFQGRGKSFGLEYQYDADSLHYGAQLIISYADGIKFRHLNRSVWSDWKQVSAVPLP